MEASNIKAMREALEDSQSLLESFSRGDYGAQVREQMRDNRVALSAPPRNCDLFDTKDKSREAFQKLRGHRVFADVSLWDNRDEIELFLDWLFATKKGATDGSK